MHFMISLLYPLQYYYHNNNKQLIYTMTFLTCYFLHYKVSSLLLVHNFP